MDDDGHNVTATRICSVSDATDNKYVRPVGAEDHPDVAYIVVSVGKAAKRSMIGTRVNTYDLQNGAEVLPWTADEWIAKGIQDLISGLPLQYIHDAPSAGGGINRNFFEPKSGELMMTAYVHKSTPNGQRIVNGVRSGDIREASLQYEMKVDDSGRLLWCKPRELSLTPKGMVPNTTIRVLNSAIRSQANGTTTKPPVCPIDIVVPIKQRIALCRIPLTTMSSSTPNDQQQQQQQTTPMQEDSRPPAAAATTPNTSSASSSSSSSTPTATDASGRPVIDLSNPSKAVQDWLALAPEQQARVDPRTMMQVMQIMAPSVQQGIQYQTQKEKAEQEAREKLMREGREQFDKIRPTLIAAAKRKGIQIDEDDETTQEGLSALFTNPDVAAYGNIIAGLHEMLDEKSQNLENVTNEKEMLLGVVKRVPYARVNVDRDEAPTPKRRAADPTGGQKQQQAPSGQQQQAPAGQQQQAPAGQQQRQFVPPGGQQQQVPQQQQDPDQQQAPPPVNPNASYAEQLLAAMLQPGALPRLHMDRGGSNGYVGADSTPETDPFFIDPSGVHKLKSTPLSTITVRNSRPNTFTGVMSSLVQLHAKNEPEPVFDQKFAGGFSKSNGGNVIPAGAASNLPALQKMGSSVSEGLGWKH